jgi:hypothetical protein
MDELKISEARDPGHVKKLAHPGGSPHRSCVANQ